MQPLTTEWIAKADGDFASANRELRARKAPNYDSACFHAQQCAEKYLKALLQESDVRFPRTHDLEILLDMLMPGDPDWDKLRSEAQLLTSLAVEVRYPGSTADKARARAALHACHRVRVMARQSLGLEP